MKRRASSWDDKQYRQFLGPYNQKKSTEPNYQNQKWAEKHANRHQRNGEFPKRALSNSFFYYVIKSFKNGWMTNSSKPIAKPKRDWQPKQTHSKWEDRKYNNKKTFQLNKALCI